MKSENRNRKIVDTCWGLFKVFPGLKKSFGNMASPKNQNPNKMCPLKKNNGVACTIPIAFRHPC